VGRGGLICYDSRNMLSSVRVEGCGGERAAYRAEDVYAPMC